MHEMRILNGYLRGATIPLGDQVCIIGASDEADVVLADPGIATRHANVSLSPEGWTLEALDGQLRNAEDNHERDFLKLEVDDFARLGPIWLTVTEEGTPWRDPPPEPVDSVAEVPDAPIPHAAEDDEVHHAVTDATVISADEATATPSAETLPTAPTNTKRGRRLLLLPLSLAALLSAAAAYAITRHYPVDAEQSLSANERLLPPIGTTAAMEPPAARMTPEQLRAAFRKRLAEVDLLKRFNLQLDDHEWVLQAALDEDESERFQRMLSSFVRAHDIDFPVRVKIGSAESMLPFRIQQVISGSNASIVTEDGRRLYIGDEYRGVVLAAIDNNQVSFTGRHNINVRW
ncbi:FHA domain-containing protein [Herbaspirillum huttiense]|uniref:FHA domain-containing protein n=2 Tax=Herbaspirillum huttiense TaxID=863372 RepID=A0AAJ2LX83_9BURK|nr:FHA domain-containing protein [Herbaspirillum huttiense]MDR9838876.1 FHA domain-containing protein [Herbaspirillum huttiense]